MNSKILIPLIVAAIGALGMIASAWISKQPEKAAETSTMHVPSNTNPLQPQGQGETVSPETRSAEAAFARDKIANPQPSRSVNINQNNDHGPNIAIIK